MKNKFPDLTGDGKVTKADILKGRGVLKKHGGSVKKKKTPKGYHKMPNGKIMKGATHKGKK